MDQLISIEVEKILQNKNLPITAPITQTSLMRYLREEYHFSIDIHPEYYRDGINWNVQVTWPLPTEECTEYSVYDGTFLYGDDGEFPTYEEALEFGFKLALEKI